MQSWGNGWKIVQKHRVFCNLLVISKVKGGCHTPEIYKVCSFWSCAFLAFAPVNTHVHWKVLSLFYHVRVNFGQLTFSSKARFPANVFHKIMEIADGLKKNAHDQNEQTTTRHVLLFWGD